ncbi:Guanine nucleotide exchange factor for Cdc42p [Dimargaris cristalligena]|nr:Guanine nucleotide exchange factor for Cdc42p [Dimargaris cristalligena]
MHGVTLRRRAPSQASSLHTIEIPVPSPALQTMAPPTSIYQRCLQLMDRLARVPGFAPFLELSAPPKTLPNSSNATLVGPDSQVPADANPSGTQLPDTAAQPYLDPIHYLWNIFRNGHSLITIYNVLRPDEPILFEADSNMTQSKQDKLKIFHFLKAINSTGLVKDAQSLIISDLFRDDTNAFIKVLDIVATLLDELERSGRLNPEVEDKPSLRFSDASTKRPENNRERVVVELLETERSYVNDLETLRRYMQEIQTQHILPEETVRLMFANLNALLDFQRRFLVGIEINSRRSADEQQFGELFMKMEDMFAVYEPYIANHDRAAEIALREANTLQKLAHIINPTFQLPSMLIKPVQRICKYELLYRELIKFSDKNAPNLKDLQDGLEATKRVANRSNETMRREENYNALKDLELRVEDWRRIDFAKFGELHLFDKFAMTTSDIVNELQLYLFDDSLICCKEVEPSKENRKSQKHQSQGSGNSSLDASLADASAAAKRKKGSLQVKGRVHLYKMHRISNTSKNGNLSLTFFWRDMVMEHFSLKFRTEEQLNMWKTTIEKLSYVAKEKEEARRQAIASSAVNAGPHAAAALGAQSVATSRVEPNVSEYVMLHPAKGSISTNVPTTPTTPSTPGFFLGGQFSNTGGAHSGYPYGTLSGYPGTPGAIPPPPKLTHVHSHNYLGSTGTSPSSSSSTPHHQLGLHGSAPATPGSSKPPISYPTARKVSGMAEDSYFNGLTHPPLPEEPAETYYYYRRTGSTAEGHDFLPDQFHRGVQISRENTHDGVTSSSSSSSASHNTQRAGNGNRSVSAEVVYRQVNTSNLVPPTANYTQFRDPPYSAHMPSNLRTASLGGSLGVTGGNGTIPFRDRSGSTPNIYSGPFPDRQMLRHPSPGPGGPNPAHYMAGSHPPPPPVPLKSSGPAIERYYSEDLAHYDDSTPAALRNSSLTPSALMVKNTSLPRPPVISTQSYNGQSLSHHSGSNQSSPIDGATLPYAPLTVHTSAVHSVSTSAVSYHSSAGSNHHLYGHRRSPSNSISQGSLDPRGSPSKGSHHHTALSPLSQVHPPPLPLAQPTGSPDGVSHSGPQVKVKVNYRSEIFALMVPSDIGYQELIGRIERKINVCTGRKTSSGSPESAAGSPSLSTKPLPPLKFTYQDEDGDFISLKTDADFQLALETRQKSPLLPGTGSGFMANASPNPDGSSADQSGNTPAAGMWSINIFAS